MSEDLANLIEKQRKLENEIKVAWQCSRSGIASALAAARGQRGYLTRDEEDSMRASARARDMYYLNSLEIDLDSVKA